MYKIDVFACTNLVPPAVKMVENVGNIKALGPQVAPNHGTNCTELQVQI